MSLRQKIEQEIRERGPIPFSRYMAMCLYDAELGYYSRNAEKFGKAGDFYTSSDVHAVYGRLLARQFEEMWQILGRPSELEIVEFGPGRGLFAQDLLDWSEKKYPEFMRAIRYVLIEGSAVLRARLQDRFAKRISNGELRVCSAFGDLTCTGENTIVFANEFFDALPVEIVSDAGELRIDAREGKFVEVFQSTSAPVDEYLDRYSVRPEAGERVEAALESLSVMQSIGTALRRGFMVVVDYGYTRAEQLEGRHRDTLMTYHQHTASPNPYQAPGEQDITAHVNFTALAATAENGGLLVHPLLTQSQFLMGIGESSQFADAFEGCVLPQERAKVALQLKHLVTPAGLGETFHVMLASKEVDREKVEELGGMSFSKSRL